MSYHNKGLAIGNLTSTFEVVAFVALTGATWYAVTSILDAPKTDWHKVQWPRAIMYNISDLQESLAVLLLPCRSYAWGARFHYHQIRDRLCERPSALWHRCFHSAKLECNG
jgi:hypothetical protein